MHSVKQCFQINLVVVLADRCYWWVSPAAIFQLLAICDIRYSTMDRKKLDKLRVEIEQMRQRALKAADVQSLATRLGRKPVKRGKHPMWESTEFKGLFALSIPDHGARDLSHGVKKIVLNQLENDILAWDERLSRKENGSGAGHGKDD